MTIKEIAKISGVGVGTVSRYLNGGSISEEKKANIAKVIEENNYVPTSAAVNLRGKSVEIMVIVGKVSDGVTSKFIDGIIEAASKKNLKPLIVASNFSEESQNRYIDQAAQKKLLGVLVYNPIGKLSDQHDNVITVGKKIPGFPAVYSNDENNYYRLVTDILTRKRINKVKVMFNQEAWGVDISQLDGAVKACKAFGIEHEVYTYTHESSGKILNKVDVEKGDYFVCIGFSQELCNEFCSSNMLLGEDFVYTQTSGYDLTALDRIFNEDTTLVWYIEEMGILGVSAIVKNSKSDYDVPAKIFYHRSTGDVYNDGRHFVPYEHLLEGRNDVHIDEF